MGQAVFPLGVLSGALLAATARKVGKVEKGERPLSINIDFADFLIQSSNFGFDGNQYSRCQDGVDNDEDGVVDNWDDPIYVEEAPALSTADVDFSPDLVCY